MAIVLKNITKCFDGKKIIDDFSAEFEHGVLNCITGASGIGKTTLLNIMMGIIKQDSGTIKGLEGKRLSAVFQEERFCENLSALGNLTFVRPRKSADSKARAVEELLALDLLPEDINKRVDSLSGGMRRRVAIARALVAEYDVAFLDEPFKGLDEGLKERVMTRLLARIAGKTVIFVTHDIREAEFMNAKIFNI